MSKTQSPFSRESHPEPVFSVHIHKKVAWSILVVLAVVAALLVFDLRARQRQTEARGENRTTGQEGLKASSPADAAESDRRKRADVLPIRGREPHGLRPSALGEGQPDWGAEPLHSRVQGTEEALNPVAGKPDAEAGARYLPASHEGDASQPDNLPDDPPARSSPESGEPVATASAAGTGPKTLLGAGATFPNPIYQKWFTEFHQVHPDVEIQYQSIGSGGGIRQLEIGIVDFAATDNPLTDQQLAKITTKVVHIPTVLGGVVPIYNLPGMHSEIKFTPEALAGIFLGRIVSWNDPVLLAANPGLRLPDRPIVVVHRSDPSAATYIFTDFLSKASRDWKNSAATGAQVSWPAGMAAKGCEGVRGTVAGIEGAIGYVELICAIVDRLEYGSVRNPAGRFVKATLESVTAAAASVRDIPPDFRVSITNAPGADAYPISSFTWLLVPEQFSDPVKGKDLLAFLRWMIDYGERSASILDFAPLPHDVAVKVKQRIAQMR
jgi:phosphate transport system substrate-binding protein